MNPAGTYLLLVFSAVCVIGCGTTTPTAQPQPPGPSGEPTPLPESVTPTPTPTPAPAPRAPAPAILPTADLDEPLIRVLLRRTTEALELPEPGRAWQVEADGGSRWMWGPLVLDVHSGSTWYQVGAFGDPSGTADAMRRLTAAFGEAVELRSESTDTGLDRVQIRWRDSAAPADPVQALASAGFEGAFASPGGGGSKLVITSREERLVVEGEAVLEPAGDFPLAADGRRYRGRLRARASGADLLLINELNLERYLLGVVPLEMGPSVFPELDALKAQSVAARTYAVAHLGDHDDEGYDICDTPACQVYGGQGAEHRLSTRAIEETAGIIAVFDGQPIDAMYTSTCGGHSEASSVLFSGRAQPYLQPVPCTWERSLELGGDSEDGPWMDRAAFAKSVAGGMLGVPPNAAPERVLEAVAATAGGASDVGAVSTDIDAFAAALLRVSGLERSAAVLTPEPPGLEALLFLTDLFGAALDPPSAENRGDWPLAAAFAVLEVCGAVVRDSGEAVPRPGGVGIFPRRAESGETLPAAVPVWERWREGFRRRASASVAPGTMLERYRHGDAVVALVVRRSGGNGEADRRSAWREWVREKKWSDLAARLGIPDLEKLEITDRSVSGRVVGLSAIGRSGQRKEWTGFGVRRALDLPETYFTVHIITNADGDRVARFLGRGWGHGVGMCQNGSYGLARAGRRYEEILGHYYTGITLVRWNE